MPAFPPTTRPTPPGLPAFMADYPDLAIVISETERWVDAVREGVDCVLRYGNLPDSDLVGRRLLTVDRLTCAAPAYLARFGTPHTLDDLDGHRMIGLRALSTGHVHPLEFATVGGYRSVTLPAPMSVTGTETRLAVARLGLGLFQVPRFHAEADLASGALVQLLPDHPPPSVPVSLLYPPNRQLSPRVRVFMDWATRQFRGRGQAPAQPRKRSLRCRRPSLRLRKRWSRPHSDTYRRLWTISRFCHGECPAKGKDSVPRCDPSV